MLIQQGWAWAGFHMSDDLKFRQESQGYGGRYFFIGSSHSRGRSNKRDPGTSLSELLFELMRPTVKRDSPEFRKSEP